MISLSAYLVNLGRLSLPAINHSAISLAKSNISQRIDRAACLLIKSMGKVSSRRHLALEHAFTHLTLVRFKEFTNLRIST